MSIESITSQVKNAEQYVIRSEKEIKNSEQAVSSQTSQSIQPVKPVKTDEYDKANPVGESVEGIYSVSHDEEGNLKVNYTQPPEKSSGANAGAGAAPVASSGTTDSTDSDEELERLKTQRDALKAQLNRETDEEVKQALRVQLQNVEAQIAMKSTGVN